MPKSKVPRTFFNIIHTDSEGTTFHCKLQHCAGEITVRKSRKGNTNQLWVHLFREHGLTRQFVLDSVAQRIPFDQQMMVLNTLENRIGHPFQVVSIIKASKCAKGDAAITSNKNKDNSDFDQSVDFDDESVPRPSLQQPQRRQSSDLGNGNGNGIVKSGVNANHRVGAAAASSSTSGTPTVNLNTPAAAAVAGAGAKSGNSSSATLGEDEGSESDSESNENDDSVLSNKNGSNTNVALINGSGVTELRNHTTNGYGSGYTRHHHNIKRSNHSAGNVASSNGRETHQQLVIEELIARQYDTDDGKNPNAQFDKGRFEKLIYLFLIDNRLPIDVVTRQSFRSLIHEASKSNESIEFVNGIGHDSGSANSDGSNNNNDNDNNTASNSTIITTNSNSKQ